MKNSEKVNQILSWYQHENDGVQKNIERLLNSGYLGGTGKLVILPVDQGFEHGPSKSFAPNPEAYDPDYHFNFAIEAGCNAYAAPLGFLEHGAKRFSEKLPLILKLNNSDSLDSLKSSFFLFCSFSSCKRSKSRLKLWLRVPNSFLARSGKRFFLWLP